jgi:hypothetical protein
MKQVYLRKTGSSGFWLTKRQKTGWMAAVKRKSLDVRIYKTVYIYTAFGIPNA